MHRGGVIFDVDARFLLELVEEEVDDNIVEIFTTEVGITVGGFNLKDAITKLENRDIECTTTEVEDGDFFVFFALETVGQSGGSRLVDDALHLEASDFAGVLGGLALRVVEVSWDGDNRLSNLFAEEGLSVGLDFAKNHRRNFFGCVFLAVHFDSDTIALLDNLVRHDVKVTLDFFVVKFATDQTFDAIDGILGVGDALALSNLAHQAVAFLGDGNNGRRGAVAFGISNHFRLASHHVGKSRVGGAKVNSNDF